MHQDLQKVFDFDESDILLNQNGHLSEKQFALLSEYRRIRKFGGKSAFGALCISSFFFITIWLYFVGFDYDARKHFEMTLAFTAVLLILWLFFLFFFFLGIMRSDLNSRKILTVAGFAEHKIKKHRNLQMYYVKIGIVKFQLSTLAQLKAIQKNKCYKVFYIKDPPAHIIISIAEIN